jgi:lipoprotein-anchoring transpeptidase ErfK/SrfK
VVVDKAIQRLTAWQGERVVFQTKVSTGRYDSSTPVGTWDAKTREPMHYSRIYDNSPMPYAIHINGNIFIHGYHSVPSRPASHGCVRVPVRGRNSAAKWLFGWIEIGTPVTIEGAWARKK